MSSVNKVILVGYVGRHAELRYTKSGQAVANFSMATTEKWTGQDEEKHEQTEWHNIVAWRKLAEICGQYVTKGRLIYVEGRIQHRDWEDREGNKRTTTEILAQTVQLLGGRGERRQSDNDSPPAAESEKDLPF